jgi:Flp pilus assembly protein TadD
MGNQVMRKFLVALMLATPMFALALGTESTPQANARDSDFVAGKKAVDDKNWQVAIRALNRAAKGDPRSADIHNYLGYAYRNMDQMDLSFKHYNEALKLDPNHRGANEYIGWAYLKTNKPAQAEEHLARLERICGKSCAEYQKLGTGIADYKAKNK